MFKPPRKTVFIFLDTDKHASAFDILTAIDLFPKAQIIKYGDVTPEEAGGIIQDIMFPRGPEGAKHTKVFIGGHDVTKATEILETAKKCMFPPFELAIIMDPRGANTTASAAVAKTLAVSIKRGFGDFNGKNVTVLAGTGPVGQIAARLYAMEGANVVVTSRKMERSTVVARKINEEFGVERSRGAQATAPDEIGESVKDAEIILSAGAAGVQLLPLNVLKKYGKKCKVVGDTNAVPPVGIEGLKPADECVEILPGTWGIGALTIGTLKNKVEARLFERAVKSSKGIFDYKIAYEIAKSMALAKLKKG